MLDSFFCGNCFNTGYPLLKTFDLNENYLNFFVHQCTLANPTKLFVGGLSWNTNEDGLRQAFEPYGTLEEVMVIRDKDTGRSRGFGFVTLSSDEEAESAISALNGQELDGRTIRVNKSGSRESDGLKGSNGGSWGSYSGGSNSGGSYSGSSYSDRPYSGGS